MNKTLQKMVGKKILAVRPMVFRELQLEGAIDGVLIDIGGDQCIAIFNKGIAYGADEDDLDEVWTEAKWMDGEHDVDLASGAEKVY